MSAIKISVTIITYNEEAHISRCLDSVSDVADEILVVDSHSTDRTCEIAGSHGAKIINNDFEGHIQQKNFAVDQAKYDFILSLDADEALSVDLIQSILKVKNQQSSDAYQCNRLNNFCGRWIRHGLWYPDKKIRLFDRKIGRWGGTNPHDKVILKPEATLQKLKGDLLHYTVSSVREYIGQVNKFSSIQATELLQRKQGVSFFHLYIKPPYKFILAYIFRLGFLDGWRGFCIAAGQAWGIYLRYVKMKDQNGQEKA